MSISFNDEAEHVLEELKSEFRYRELVKRPMASFAHNDYLGLSRHPKILDAVKEGLDLWGAGSTGSRLLGGHSELFERTENEIAEFFGAPEALLFSSGYLANLAAMTSLGSLAEMIVSDELNHASLIDGVALSKTGKRVIPHQSWEEIPKSGRSLLVTEGLFSMDGDIIKSETLLTLLSESQHFLYLDEAHSAGVLGEEGRGLHTFFPDWERKAVTVTFGKAFGVSGAAILCAKNIKEIIINRGRSFIFSTAPSPLVLLALRASLQVMKTEGEGLRRRLKTLCHHFTEKMGRQSSPGPIIPVIIPGEKRVLEIAAELRGRGFDVRAIRWPTVKKGGERIRLSMNLGVSEDDVVGLSCALTELTSFALSSEL